MLQRRQDGDGCCVEGKRGGIEGGDKSERQMQSKGEETVCSSSQLSNSTMQSMC